MKQTAPRRTTWKLLSCAVKAPLGCLAFFIGAAVVFVIFLPPALGNLVSQELETWFDDTHEGSLELKEAWLGSLYGPQKVESITLRDPQRNEVLHATLRAPSLRPVFVDEARRWGPVELHVDSLRIESGRDGVSNLARAVARSSQGAEDGESDFSITRDLRFELQQIDVVVRIDRLSWSDGLGRQVRVVDVECNGLFDGTSPFVGFTLEGLGRLEGRGDGEVAGEGEVGFRLELRELLRFNEPDDPSPWTLVIELRNAPTLAAEALLGRVGELQPDLGPTLELARVELTGRGRERLRLAELELASEQGRVSLSGAFAADGTELLGEEGDVARLAFPVDSDLARRVFPAVLPLAGDVRFLADGWATLELEEFELPVRGDPREAVGRCRLEFGELEYELPTEVRERLALGPRPLRLAGPVELRVSGGLAHFERFSLPTGHGLLEVQGSVDLRRGDHSVLILAPAGLGGETLEVVGSRDAPRVRDPRD